MNVLHYDSLMCPKTRALTMKNVPAQIKEFIQNVIRVFNKFVLKIKNHSCDVTKVLKKVVQISCPIPQNRINCGLFAVVICLHIFEGTEIGPHIFTHHEITKLRTCLLSLLVEDKKEMYYGIQSIFDYLPGLMPSSLSPQGVLPRSPLGGVELPQTFKLIAGGSFVGNISYKSSRFTKNTIWKFMSDTILLVVSLFSLRSDNSMMRTSQYQMQQSSREHSGASTILLPALQVKMRMIWNHLCYSNKITDDNQDIAQYSETSNEGDSSSNHNEDTRTSSNMGINKQM